MRIWIYVCILVITFVGSSFWYDFFIVSCKIPILYTVGDIDKRFDTTDEEIQRIAMRAEAIWEDALGENIFMYDPHKGIPINLIFDERQETSQHEAELRADLKSKEGMSESVAKQYDALISKFRTQKKQYESHVSSYETAFNAYNTEVDMWNKKGGAPEHILERFEKEKEKLRIEYETLQNESDVLTQMVTELNRIGAKGNVLIEDFNNTVSAYNTQFSESYEFTQGDYARTSINIYQFDSEDELVIVLAHEFGHALTLDHVSNEKSIMFPIMEKQDINVGVTSEDTTAFKNVCDSKNGFFNFLKKTFFSYI
jgi:hypothetical protein